MSHEKDNLGIRNEGGEPFTFSKAFLKSRMGSSQDAFPAKPFFGAAKGQSKPCGFLDFEFKSVPNTEESLTDKDLKRWTSEKRNEVSVINKMDAANKRFPDHTIGSSAMEVNLNTRSRVKAGACLGAGASSHVMTEEING